jgi:hypothetical protein
VAPALALAVVPALTAMHPKNLSSPPTSGKPPKPASTPAKILFQT